jgi:hypothetical protein
MKVLVSATLRRGRRVDALARPGKGSAAHQGRNSGVLVLGAQSGVGIYPLWDRMGPPPSLRIAPDICKPPLSSSFLPGSPLMSNDWHQESPYPSGKTTAAMEASFFSALHKRPCRDGSPETYSTEQQGEGVLWRAHSVISLSGDS